MNIITPLAALCLGIIERGDPKLFSLLALVIAQVVVFQGLMTRISLAMPGQLLGGNAQDPPLDTRVAAWRRNLGRGRRLLGLILIVAALVLVLLLPGTGIGRRKIALAAISLVSTGILLAGMIRDARRLLAMKAALPEDAPRAASLERRSLAAFVDRRWELPPAALVLASIGLALWSGMRLEAAPIGLSLLFPLSQAAVYLLTLWLAARLARAPWPMGARELARDSDPARTLSDSRAYRRHDLRSFAAARMIIALLLLVIQVQWIGERAGETFPVWLAVADRAVLILMLGLLAVSLVTIPRALRR